MTVTGSSTNELRPLGIGEILDAALRVYRNHFKTLVLAVLAVVLPLSILDTLITASTAENAFNYSSETTVDADGAFLAGQLVSGILSLLVFSLATAACFHAVMRGYRGEATTTGESLKFGLRHMLPMIGLGILAFLGLVPMFLLLLLPGIWLAVRWSVAAPALLAEDIGPVAALGRSFKLVGGRWWATFGALVAMTILVSILQLIVGMLIGLVFADADNEVLVAIVFTLVTAFAYALTLPIQAAVFTILYFDLRVRKEGYDLQLAASGMGEGAAQPQAAPVAFGAPTSPSPSPQSSDAAPGGFAPPASPSAPPSGVAAERPPEQAPGGGAAPGTQ